MNVSISLASFALLVSASSLPASHDDAPLYVVSVTFERGECWIWTGDVGLTAAQFQSDLEARFDKKRGIVITHAPATPTRCVQSALNSARRAGFKIVKAQSRHDAGPIGPPLNGS